MTHRIEVEQRRLQDELPDGATVLEAVEILLGLDPREGERLVMRQLVEADRVVPRYVEYTRSVRRAGVGCGFMAGMLFVLAVQAAEKENGERGRD